MKYPALFLDRDGTLVHPSRYPSRPEQLSLYDGIGTELRILQRMGLRLVVITNQSGIARGYFTETDLRRMHEYLVTELAKQAVYLAGIYHCPHHPDGVVPELAVRCVVENRARECCYRPLLISILTLSILGSLAIFLTMLRPIIALVVILS